MTRKTFKSTMGQADLTIEKQEGGVAFVIVGPRGNYMKVTTPPEVAAEQALAILEAAGVEPDLEPFERPATLGTIAADLRATIKHAEAQAAEAREQAELEAEALELMNAYRKSFLHCAPEDGFDGFDDPDRIKAKWLAVARRARELAKEATK